MILILITLFDFQYGGWGGGENVFFMSDLLIWSPVSE